jgi:hypothetical protein
VRLMQQENLKSLLCCNNDIQFWKFVRTWLDAKKHPAQVSISQIKNTFEAQMNPPAVFPSSFNKEQWEFNKLANSAIPSVTTDLTAGLHFSRAFSLEEIEHAKSHIKSHSAKSAKGCDDVSYAKISEIQNEELQKLFQACMDHTDSSAAWLVTIIIAILKKGKPGDNPEGYCLIGLESCLLKFLTLLIAKRL